MNKHNCNIVFTIVALFTCYFTCSLAQIKQLSDDEKVFLSAVKEGNVEVADSYLQKSFEYAFVSEEMTGNYAIEVACKRDDVDMARLLIRYGGNSILTTQNRIGQTPLHSVASDGTLGCLKLLLDAAIERDLAVKFRRFILTEIPWYQSNVTNVLLQTIRRRQPNAVALLLQFVFKRTEPFTSKADYFAAVRQFTDRELEGFSSLLLNMAAQPNEEVLKILMDYGVCWQVESFLANLKPNDPPPEIALHQFVGSNEAGIIRTILSHRNCPMTWMASSSLAHGFTLAHTLASLANEEVFDLLFPIVTVESMLKVNDEGQNMFHFASRGTGSSYSNLKKMFQRTSAGCDSLDYMKRSPIFYAAISGGSDVYISYDMVNLFLKKCPDAKLSIADAQDHTVLQAATKRHNPTSLTKFRDLFQLLIANGAGRSPAEEDWYKMSVKVGEELPTIASLLHFIPFFGWEDSDRYLVLELALGTGMWDKFVDVFDAQGKAPIHYAAENGQGKSLETLVKYGADINQPDSIGMTPLMYTCSHSILSDVSALKTALRLGGKVNLQTKKTKLSALHLAVSTMNLEKTKLLVANGADITLKNKKGQTAADIAEEMENEDLINYFKKLQEGNEKNHNNKKVDNKDDVVDDDDADLEEEAFDEL